MNTRRFKKTTFLMKRIAMTLALLFMTVSANASEGGVSNYIPGFYGDLALAVEPPDGLAIRNDVYHYSGDAGRSVRAGQIEADIDINLTYDFLSFLYKPGIKALGGQVAFGLTVPVGYVDIDAGLQAGPLRIEADDDRSGLGDATLAANFYWNKGKFNFAWGNYLVMPTGVYDKDNLANIGLNYWTIETDFMATYFDTDKGQDYSVVIGYGYNTENDDTDYQSGDEFHIDYVLNQFITESFAVGISGFYYKQLSGDSGDGALLGDFKGEASGIGPAVYYNKKIAGRDVYFTAKWISEYDVKNRLEGDHVFASFAMSF